MLTSVDVSCEHPPCAYAGNSSSSVSRRFYFGNIGMWRSLVARTAGGGEVAGSSPVIPTILQFHTTYAII